MKKRVIRDDSDVVVRLVDMPTTVRACVSESPDGCYNIYINARQSKAIQYAAYLHELEHIRRGDLRSDKPLERIEAAAKK